MRKKKQQPGRLALPSVTVTEALNRRIKRLRRRLADRLNAMTASWTRPQCRLFLLLVSLGFVSAGSAVICLALRPSPAGGSPAWNTARISFHYAMPEVSVHKPGAAEIGEIERFSRYMDSLSQTAGGKRIYDSICKARPGLLDSVAAVERIYNNKK